MAYRDSLDSIFKILVRSKLCRIRDMGFDIRISKNIVLDLVERICLTDIDRFTVRNEITLIDIHTSKIILRCETKQIMGIRI